MERGHYKYSMLKSADFFHANTQMSWGNWIQMMETVATSMFLWGSDTKLYVE